MRLFHGDASCKEQRYLRLHGLVCPSREIIAQLP